MPEVQSEAQKKINAYWADKLMAWSSKKKEQVIPVAMALQESGFAAEEVRTRCIITHSVFVIIASHLRTWPMQTQSSFLRVRLLSLAWPSCAAT